ncbi:MAG: hypothetical protein ACRCSK_03785 [Fusobacteriaceae bacterium]
MFNKLILILSISFILFSCTSLDTRQLSQAEKNQLETSLEKFEQSLRTNSINSMKYFFDDTIKNKYVISTLRGTDFSKVKIFYSLPKFDGTKATNTVAFSSSDKTVYYMLTYRFIKESWLITDIREK